MITKAEIKAVSFVLNQDHEGKSVEEVAKLCIGALNKLRETDMRPFSGPLQVGDMFKMAGDSTTWYVRWVGMVQGLKSPAAWVVSDDSTHGSLVTADAANYILKVQPAKGINRTVKTIDPDTGEETSEKKYYPPKHEFIGTNDLGLVEGDRVHYKRSSINMTVIAVFSNGALLRSESDGNVWPESNAYIKSHYEDGWK